MRQLLAGVAVDITPLRRSRDFRYLYAGTAVGQIGSAFTTVAVLFQIYDLTGSTLAIGLFGAVTLVPLLVLNVVGGAFADKVERRRWIVGCQLVGLTGTLGLVVNSTLEQPNLVAISNAMVTALPVALFPAVAVLRFPDRPHVLGLLYAAPFAGSLVASLASGWARRVRAHGRVVTVCTIVWGLAIAAFGLVDGVVLSLLALAVGGAADMISGISRQAILQLASPPELVGRMEGVGMAIWSGGPRLGDLRAGAVASFTSVPFAIVSGGLGCALVMVVLAKALPGFARYEAPRDDAPARAGASITI
jgi:MFS family permease